MELTNETQGRLLDCLLDLGQLLLGCGAEISRVEDTLTRVGRAYGAAETDVFVITSIISLTMEFPGHEAVTETRRIVRDDGTDFYRLEKLNALSRAVCAEPMEVDELRARIDAVAAGRKPFRVQLFGSILAAGSFAVFFGGSVWDGLAAAVLGALICLLQLRLDRTEINTVARNLLVSFLIGVAAELTDGGDPGAAHGQDPHRRYHAAHPGPCHDERRAQHPARQHDLRSRAPRGQPALGGLARRRLHGRHAHLRHSALRRAGLWI